jgi:lipopolysaccharide/colanic/teichoic acid biosynthesis glycosyltransferase
VKRTIDVSVAALGLLLLSPLLGAVAAVVLLALGRPLFFTQERLGRDGRPFRIIKFRTMLDRRDADGQLLPEAERLTRVGQFLRRTSLDELPELLNVLRGEMSLVGPRPFMAIYGPRYTAEQARRHDVLPGITGWAQVNGRNLPTWEERFALDLYYIDHWSLLLDLRIITRTVTQVVTGSGVRHAGHVTMPEYAGPSTPDGEGPAAP